MDKSHPLSSPIVVRSLEVSKDPFRPKEENEELLGLEVSYLNAIGALMYLVNYTRLDITFSVNLLARYNSAPTKRHWNGIKHMLRYLRGTSDMGLGQVTWDYFIPKQWNHNYLAMQMQDIFQTLTKVNHKQDIYLLMEILQYPGDQLNKQWWPPPLIIQKYLRCMKLVENVFR